MIILLLIYFFHNYSRTRQGFGERKQCCCWLEQQEMVANPEKFHALLVRKDRKDTRGQNISFQGHEIKSEENSETLGHNSGLQIVVLKLFRML